MRRSSRHAGIAVALVACASLAHGGCGEGRPPLLGSDFAPPTASGSDDAGQDSGPQGTLDFDGGSVVCPRLPDGGVCGCLDLPVLADPPNLYFVLDRSGSMNDEGKWDTIRVVVTELIRKLGPRAKYGAAVFPDPRLDNCAPGIEVMAPLVGSAPAGTYGKATATFGLSTKFVASGGTPTAATLAGLRNRIASFEGKTFIILATDGGPNCDSAITCDVDRCIPNIEGAIGCPTGEAPNCCEGSPESCLDGSAAVEAVASLQSAGIPTYVVGVPGSAPYANLLADMAIAGGTQRYYEVTSAGQSAFAQALSEIAAKITATCTFDLGQNPPDPEMVNVYFDDSVVPREGANGWTLSGETVTLIGDSCAKVLTGQVLQIRIVAGCPTVLK